MHIHKDFSDLSINKLSLTQLNEFDKQLDFSLPRQKSRKRSQRGIFPTWNGVLTCQELS